MLCITYVVAYTYTHANYMYNYRSVHLYVKAQSSKAILAIAIKLCCEYWSHAKTPSI